MGAGLFRAASLRTPACTVKRTGLSSDLCRVCDGGRVDVLVAVRADDERLAPHFRHERCPRGLPGSGLAELAERGDLVDDHCGSVLAQFAQPPLQPADQFLAGVVDLHRCGVGDDRAPVTLEGYPAESRYQVLLAFAVPVGFQNSVMAFDLRRYGWSGLHP